MQDLTRARQGDSDRTKLLKDVVRSQVKFGAALGGESGSRKKSVKSSLAEVDVDVSYLRQEKPSEAWRKHATGLRVEGGPDLDDLRSSALADNLFVQMADADDMCHLLEDSCDRLGHLCSKLEMEEPKYSVDPLRFDHSSGHITICDRPKQGGARAERAKVEMSALAYITRTCQWKDLDKLDNVIEKADYNHLRQSFPRFHQQHHNLPLLTDVSLHGARSFQRAVWAGADGTMSSFPSHSQSHRRTENIPGLRMPPLGGQMSRTTGGFVRKGSRGDPRMRTTASSIF